MPIPLLCLCNRALADAGHSSVNEQKHHTNKSTPTNSYDNYFFEKSISSSFLEKNKFSINKTGIQLQFTKSYQEIS